VSLLDNPTTTTNINESKHISLVSLQQLLNYIVFTGLGLLGGASGVALAIGLAIVPLAFSSEVFWPNILLLTIIAVLIGVGISWLLGRTIKSIFSHLFEDVNNHGIQIMLMFSVFTSLLQTFLFMRDL
jgi:hypothetical protein